MKNKEKIVIIGAGGFGREVYYFLNDMIYNCVGFIDYNKIDEKLPLPIIGFENEIEGLIEEYQFSSCVIAIGDINKRKMISNNVQNFPIRFPSILHSSIQCYTKDIGNGTIVYPGVVIMNDCKVGKHTLINSGVTLGHDVLIGDYCNINPGAHLAGHISVGNGSLIGIGASIKEEITIGDNSVIGAGSVVINDIPDNATVYGVPAKAVIS
jgi:sugar O-acyltransferase (sialic acid O-acetyltransferase NeuD family)|tara:strand:- start:8569 stop:9198 length:630 start_codon:yes stop_codon:yes gene_type:complete